MNMPANFASEQRKYDRELPDDDVEIESWVPMASRQLTVKQIELWITNFAKTGDIEDELGQYKNYYGTVEHAVAQQWVADKEMIGGFIGPSFWRWAKACAYISA